jgi:hypothetical protein
MIQTVELNHQQHLDKVEAAYAVALSAVQNTFTTIQDETSKNLTNEKVNVEKKESELAIIYANLKTSRRNELSYSDRFLRVTNETDLQYNIDIRWDELYDQIVGGAISGSTIYSHEQKYTTPNIKGTFSNVDVSIIQNYSENANTESLINHLTNRINAPNAVQLLLDLPNVTTVSAAIAPLSTNVKAKCTIVARERYLKEHQKFGLRTIFSFGDENNFIDVIIPILRQPMDENGYFLNSNELNKGYHTDLDSRIKRTNNGKRLLRLFLACGKALTDKGYRVSIFLSDSLSPGNFVSFRENLREFLTSSNGYDMTKVEINKLENQTFNLLTVISGGGVHLGQLCISLLRYDRVLLSTETCPFYAITIKNSIVVTAGIKGGVST